jgi:hypothetical protein
MTTLTLSSTNVRTLGPSAAKVGRGLSALAVAFLLFDTAIKFTHVDAVAQSMTQLGIPAGYAPSIGVLELVCLAIYLIPSTALLGVVILTGYLGGAIALHVRVGNPLFSHVLFPTYIAALLWGGLYLREPRLRALLPRRLSSNE